MEGVRHGQNPHTELRREFLMAGSTTPDLDVDLRLECQGHVISVHSQDGCFVTQSRDLGGYAQLSKALGPRRSMLRLARLVSKLVGNRSLSLQVRVADNVVVAEFGQGTRNWFLAIFGLPNVKLRRPLLWLNHLLTGR